MGGVNKNAKASVTTSSDQGPTQFDLGEKSGIEYERNRVKTLMDDKYKKLQDEFCNEVNIAKRYELKLRIEELQDTYRLLFLKGE